MRQRSTRSFNRTFCTFRFAFSPWWIRVHDFTLRNKEPQEAQCICIVSIVLITFVSCFSHGKIRTGGEKRKKDIRRVPLFKTNLCVWMTQEYAFEANAFLIRFRCYPRRGIYSQRCTFCTSTSSSLALSVARDRPSLSRALGKGDPAQLRGTPRGRRAPVSHWQSADSPRTVIRRSVIRESQSIRGAERDNAQNGRTEPRDLLRARLPGLPGRANGAIEPGEHPPGPDIQAAGGEGVEGPERPLADASPVREGQSDKRAGTGESVNDAAAFPRVIGEESRRPSRCAFVSSYCL